ncbi:MAG: hypothetical protein J6Y93_01135, partial [Treponema sp.]|nr:hypothetical protein [Treponema sp.]
IFSFPENTVAQIGSVNIKFAFDWLEENKIKIVNSDTGGVLPRKIFFDPHSFKVYLKYIKNAQVKDNEFLKDKEIKYFESLESM